MVLNDFGGSVADTGHPLVCVETRRSTSSLEPARIEDQPSFTRTKVTKRGNLRDTIVKQTSIAVSHSCAVNLLGICKHIGETDKRVRHYRFIGHGRTKHVGNCSCPGVRFVLALDRGRIRNLIPVPPPETDGELLDFALIVVANKNLGVVANVVIDAGRPLAVVLPEDFRLDVIVGT